MNVSKPNASPSTAPALLILGQTPPPWHGQAVATKMLFDHDWGDREVKTLRMAYSDEMHTVGRLRIDKIFHLFDLIKGTRRLLTANPNTILFYPPASANWIPFLRDVVYLSKVRHMAAGTVFIFHASGLADWISRSRIRSWLARKAYGDADLALEVAIEEIPPHRIFQTAKWEWCPCAAEVPLMERKIPQKNKPLDALFVGSLQEGKGILEIVRTAAVLKQRGFGESFRMIVVGRWFSEEFRRETERLVADLGVEDIVVLAGELTGDAKWQAYQEADVFFFPSHYKSEASPIVLMEALGAGLPIVTTHWRGIPTLMEGCKSGWLMPVKQPEKFADALIEIDGRRDEFPSFAKESRTFYESRYRPEHFTGRIERALDENWPTDLHEQRQDNRQRILQVFNQYAEQGGEEVWVDQVSSLTDSRLRVDELRFQSRSWKMRGAPSRVAQAWRMWDNPESRARLRRKVAALQPDVLLFHNLIPVASFGVYEEAKELGVPVIQYIHNFRPFSPSGTLWHGGKVRDEALYGNSWPEIFGRAWERSLPKTALLAFHLHRLIFSGWLDTVDCWIAVSEFMRKKFIEAGIPEEKITTLRHCWTPKSEGVPTGDGDYYLFLGRLVPEKGVRMLLKSWEKLEVKLGSACPKLVIAGAGREEARVMARAKESKVVEYVGFVTGDAKRDLLAGSRAVLAPSIWWEPLGLIVYEAYDFGKPVIAAKSGGLVETVQEGEGGFLHEPGDCASLIEAIQKLESMNPNERESMGRTGRNWLLQNASPEAWKAGFEQIMAKVRNV